MDDKYRKEYEKQREQFKKHSEDRWIKTVKETSSWHQPELPFNEHRQGATGAEGYDPRYHDTVKEIVKKTRTKPDPATVEAELQLEEKLWAS
jgi:hypothetical protein